MSYNNPRINNLDMSMMDIVLALAEGNPGATRVLVEIVKAAPDVDPDSALGALGPLCGLDNLDCYGSRIWMLYKYVCGHDVRKTIGVLRCVQMGFISGSILNKAIDGECGQIDISALFGQLKESLPKFQIEAVSA